MAHVITRNHLTVAETTVSNRGIILITKYRLQKIMFKARYNTAKLPKIIYADHTMHRVGYSNESLDDRSFQIGRAIEKYICIVLFQ